MRVATVKLGVHNHMLKRLVNVPGRCRFRGSKCVGNTQEMHAEVEEEEDDEGDEDT